MYTNIYTYIYVYIYIIIGNMGGAIDTLVEKERRATKAEKLNRIVVHMRRKGLKKHSSIADAFMDIFNTENENRTHSFDVSDIRQTGINEKDVYSNLNFSQSLDLDTNPVCIKPIVTADPPKVCICIYMNMYL
jgi:hypothetical protein